MFFQAPAATPAPVPEIQFEASADFLKLPAGMNFGEVAGIAVDGRNHVYAFVRTGARSTVHGGVASQLFEFGPDGTFLKEIGKDLYGFALAHTVRIDADGNLWATAEGTNMVMKFSPAGKVLMVLGRRAEAVEAPPATPPGQVPRPQWGGFHRPRAATWGKAGSIFITARYHNSPRVRG